jgi:prepilin-type N-terminal cleavage/methylation domain-containing protein
MRASSRQEGYTLLEVVAALVVIGIALAGALGAAAADLRASRRAADAVEAAALAEDLLARMELLSADELAALGVGMVNRFEAPMDRFQWRADVAAVNGEPGLIEVRVSVRGPEVSVEVSTRVARSVGVHDGGGAP